MFHEPLFQVAGAADGLPGFYYLWGGMNDSRVKWFLSAVDHETLSDGRYLSKRSGLELKLSSDKLILLQYSQSFYDTRRSDRWDNLEVWAYVMIHT